MKGPSKSRLAFFCLHPAELPGDSIAAAATRAGHVGIMDLSRCSDAQIGERLAAGLGSYGVRVDVEQVDSLVRGEERGADVGPVMVCDADPLRDERLAAAARTLHAAGFETWLEVPSLPVLDAIGALLGNVAHGIVVRGQEVGGFCGESAATLLLQAALRSTQAPIVVFGGLGAGGIAACSASGANGVVLDDQLLLLRESPLAPDQKGYLAGLTAEASLLTGTTLGAPCRVLQQARFRLTKALRDQALESEASGLSAEDARAGWLRFVRERLGFRAPEQSLWPVGQGLVFAEGFRETYRTVGRALSALQAETARRIESAAAEAPLTPGGTLALRLGTTYPVVQGPMTRVSDKVDFALAVSDAGALPALALGVMRAEEVEVLLRACGERFTGRAWAAGLLGFLDPAILDGHIAAVIRAKPTHVILAGGHPNQVQMLEAAGIKTFVHVASPAALGRFVSAGARRFIFEGRECGGHVGPTTSAILWEVAVDRLLALAGHDLSEYEVLFAGGIHDAASAGMATIIAEPLLARGGAWGVLMGSAYVYTAEAVSSGALVEGFQQAALTCRRTVTIESAPGHANRCADTPFVELFAERRRRLLAQSRGGDEVRSDLDSLLLGRLRIASKGVARAEQGLVGVDEADQRRDGMFMIGDCAVLKSAPTTLSALHTEVTTGASDWLAEQASEAPVLTGKEDAPARPSDIAIIGIGMVSPGADGTESFWDLVLKLEPQFREIPRNRWDWRFFDDPEGNDPDASVCRWGCFLDPILFDPLRFNIPPRSVRNIAPAQLLMLEMTRRALSDAGYERGGFDRENTAVIFGAADAAGVVGDAINARALVPLIAGPAAATIKERLPELTDETFPGGLTSIVAGRVANRFDCGGANLTVDSACASGLTAMDLGVQALESKRANLALVGAVDLGQTPGNYAGFSRTGALSPTGTERVFDQEANGFVPGEAAVVMVLKRLEDARRDGDRVYAVIKSIAGSSDGRAMGMTAPHPAGQMRAMRRAYAKAAVDASTVALYEAHGTGTRVGDQAEVESYGSLLRAAGSASGSCTLGSLKSIFGHAKTCAAMLGVAKAALAVHHGVLPGHTGARNPIAPLTETDTPLSLYAAARPWLAPADSPRRAAVSAFGFGGTNSHAVLEEDAESIASSRACGALAWPQELLVFRGRDPEDLQAQLGTIRRRLGEGSRPRVRELAAACAEAAAGRLGDAPAWVATAVVDNDWAALDAALESLEGALKNPDKAALPLHLGLEQQGEVSDSSQLALMFPGQGAQYLEMGREAGLYLDCVRQVLSRSQQALSSALPEPLDRYLFPPQSFTEQEREGRERRLTDTRIAQPAIGAVSAGYTALLEACQVRPGLVAGHSFGELTALHVAGALSLERFLEVAAVRGELMGAVDAPGAMAAVFASREAVQQELAGFDNLVIANHNGERQVVISGPSDEVEAVCARFTELGLRNIRLRVSSAFHSPMMRESSVKFADYLSQIEASAPQLTVYSNLDGQPVDPADVLGTLPRQLTEPVEFLNMINNMVAHGVRVFVDAGPMDTIATLLRAMPLPVGVRVVALDGGRQGLSALLRGIAELWRLGQVGSFRPLFAGRVESVRSIEQVLDAGMPEPLHGSIWHVDGQAAWQGAVAEALDPNGSHWPARKPLYSVEEVEQERAAVPPSAGVAGFGMGAVAQAVPGDVDLSLVYQAYSETMRSFISSQERLLLAMMGETPEALPFESQTPEPTSSLASAVSALTGAAAGRAGAAAQATESVPAAAGDEPPLDGSPHSESTDPLDVLVQTVSAVTGYPGDMLRFDVDMEAELGIDSLKRIEIVEALARAFPPLLAQGTEALSRMRTLQSWADVILGLEEPAAHPATEQATPMPAAPLGRDIDWSRLVLKIIAEVTGYPPDMLQPDQDLEAELGIDSLRRIEIAERIGDAAKTQSRKDISATLGELGRLRSLREWVQFLESLDAGSAAGAEQATEQAPASAVQRYVMQGREAPLRGTSVPAAGRFLITRDRLGVADELERTLIDQGAAARILDLQDENDALRVLEWLDTPGPALSGIVHLAALDPADCLSDYSAWRQASQTQVKAFFQLLKQARPFLGAAHGQRPRLISASLLGGRFGRFTHSASIPVVGAGAAGILKCLHHEWQDVSIRCIDFDSGLQSTRIAAFLDQELAHDTGETEVGYTAEQRLVFEPAPVPLEQREAGLYRLPDQGVLVATGGARGITSLVVKALGTRSTRVILIGRRELSPTIQAGPFDAEAAAELRAELIARDRTAGVTRTPKAIEGEVVRTLQDREARSTIAVLEQAGARVDYRTCDVASPEAFGDLLDELQSKHRIDLLIHGAGVIEDSLLTDKANESFDRVFDTKADSAFTIVSHLQPGRIGNLVFFASTAARFGNTGQSDYAAANEVLNRLAWAAQAASSSTRFCAVNWGPWVGAGMVDAGLERHFREQGVPVISAAAGVEFLRKELAQSPPLCEVIFGGGPWAESNLGHANNPAEKEDVQQLPLTADASA